MKLSLTQGIATIVITLLGSGVFIVPALSATYSGWIALILRFIMAIMILPVAFIFGKLGKIYPSAGGSATFIKEAFGENIGFAAKLLYLSIIPIGPPVVIITAASYLAGAFGQEYLLFFIILASLIVLILNLTNITISSNINIGISAIIITIISTFFIMALFRFNHINYYKFHIVKTLTTIFWCFVGIEAMSHISHEFKKENDFFKAVVIGIIVVAFLYMAITFSLFVFNAYGNENKNLHSLIVVASYIMPYTDKVLAIMAFVICIMALNLYVASLTRLSTTLNIKFKTALFIIMGIILIVSVLKFLYDLKIDFLISYSNGVFVLIYFLVSLSALKILKSKTALLAVISMGAIIALLKADMLYALIMLGVFLLSKKLKNFKFSQ